jgi:hypothetical protein
VKIKGGAIVALIGSAMLSGCSGAPRAADVSAEYVPTAQYSNYSCEQLFAEAESLRRSTPALEAAVDSHRATQTGVEVVTWVLFWPAAFLLDDGDKQSSQLAQARGQLQAIQMQLQNKKCGQ